MHFKWEAGLLVTAVICLALLYLWYDSRALNHRLRLPGPGHGSSWGPDDRLAQRLARQLGLQPQRPHA